MPHSLEILVNDFAIRCFRETADKDYIAARMAYRARLIQPYLWSALHSLEKYMKGVLLLNRVRAHKGHKVLPGVERMKQSGKFELDLSGETVEFIKTLEEFGAEYRYYEVSYHTRPYDIVRLDRAVWELRRYCQPLDYDTVVNGEVLNMLAHELDRIHGAKARKEKGTCVRSGVWYVPGLVDVYSGRVG